MKRGRAYQRRGGYLMILELPPPAAPGVGSLGRISFPPGWCAYAGSAQRLAG